MHADESPPMSASAPLWVDRCRSRPFAHQVIGTEALIAHSFFALFDEPRCGKSKQVIDAACVLSEQRKINAVIVVTPAYARSVWTHPEVGQIKKHSWLGGSVIEMHKKLKEIWCSGEGMEWLVTNYEALRNATRLKYLIDWAQHTKALLVCDESSYLANRTAQQTKAILKLRAVCARCVLLNGTPGSPLDQWSQMNVLSPTILANDFSRNFYHFRSEYCNMESIYVVGGRKATVLSKKHPYKRLDDLSRRTAPYILRRLKKDCLALPPKIGGIDSDMPVFREVALSAESWKRYQQLRKEAVVELAGREELQLEPNIAVRVMRLAQLTSGQIGISNSDEVENTSSEKIDWCAEYVGQSQARFVIVWCRWRRERERLVAELNGKLCNVWQIYGNQPKNDREAAVQRFMLPDPTGQRHVLIAQPAAGGFALDLAMATEAVYLSNTRRLIDRLQSEERPHSTNQKYEYSVLDVLATGPDGQRTIDHTVWDQLRRHKEIADMTMGEWRKELA